MVQASNVLQEHKRKGNASHSSQFSNDRLTSLEDKVPAASIIKPKVKVAVSPTAEDDILALKAKNQVLITTLKKIQEKADQEAKKHYDLVWFARNRSRYPNSEARKRIEQEHEEELAKLEGGDGAGDFHHGVHMGVLAASKIFQEHAAVVDIIHEHDSPHELLAAATEHLEKADDKQVEIVPATEMPKTD